MFTCNPVSGDPSMVAVNASWGLGLAVVGGEVTPGRLSSSARSPARWCASTCTPSRSSTFPTPAAAARSACGRRRALASVPASTGRARALVEVGKRVERHFGSHQDIEWAIARGGSAEALFVRAGAAGHRACREEAEKPRPTSAMSL